MADQSPTNPGNLQMTSAEREQAWTLLDKRPAQSEIISYDPDELAEVRRLTESDLKLISRRSGTESALNKETQAFLDAASIVRALSHVAENRFEQGKLDAAAQTVINAIRWQRLADGLFLSGGVTLPRINPVRLWYLLAEIYVRMDERDLALKTMQKAGASIGEFGSTPLADLLNEKDIDSSETGESLANSGGYQRLRERLTALRSKRSTLVVAVILVIALVFTGIRAQVSTKSMIDNSSVGVDFLNIAYGPTGEQDETLILAAQEFATLRAKLDSWSWLIKTSSILPPVHDQFVAMDRLADLGSRMVAAPYAGNGTGRLADFGSPASVCAAARHLRDFNGNLLDQLEKNRTQMLESVPLATQGACGTE